MHQDRYGYCGIGCPRQVKSVHVEGGGIICTVICAEHVESLQLTSELRIQVSYNNRSLLYTVFH